MNFDSKVRYLYVFCSPIGASSRLFATHVPLRLKRQFDAMIELHVLYSGNLDTAKLESEGITVHRYRKMRGLHLLSLAFAVRRIVLVNKIEIVSNVWQHFWVWLLKISVMRTGTKVVARIAGDPTNIRKRPVRFSRRWLRRKFGRLSESFSLRFADGVHFVSESLKETVCQRYCWLPNCRIAVISQGVDLKLFPFRAGKSNCLNRMLFVGRMAKQKGTKDLLSVFSILISDFPDLTLTLAGPGVVPEIPEEVLEKTHVMGMVEHVELAKVYEDSDILVLFSKSEGLPNVVLEAMACGVIVIASSVGDVPVLLSEGRGYLVAPDDPENLYMTLKGVLNSDVEIADFVRRKARKYVEKHHGFESNRNLYLSFWRNQVKAFL